MTKSSLVKTCLLLFSLASLLGLFACRSSKDLDPTAAPEAAGNRVIQTVEWAGSGILIARGLKITPETTYQDLTETVAVELGDGTYPYAIHLFNGHGGPEITEDTDIRNLEIETLVVTRAYLKLQRIVMAKLYELFPDGVSKDGAIAKLNDYPIYASKWLGVTEVSSEGFILAINLSRKQLTGKIPPELGQLIELRTLNLSYNKLTGQIPPDLRHLTKLRRLDLSSNKLTGPIPPELRQLTKLQILYLSSNQFTGAIPSELGLLTELEYLVLSSNKLTKKIPPELGNLTNLIGLSLFNNSLTGPIPPELGNLTKLQYLLLSYNRLTGAIPSELGQLRELKHFYLISNKLTGPIPPELIEREVEVYR